MGKMKLNTYVPPDASLQPNSEKDDFHYSPYLFTHLSSQK